MQIVEKWPIFSGCEDIVIEEERRKCFSEKMTDHIKDNFDVKQNNWGTQEKIIVHFKIDKSGRVSQVRATRGDKLNRTEAERIVKMLPKFTPAVYQGRKVSTTYSLPININ